LARGLVPDGHGVKKFQLLAGGQGRGEPRKGPLELLDGPQARLSDQRAPSSCWVPKGNPEFIFLCGLKNGPEGGPSDSPAMGQGASGRNKPLLATWENSFSGGRNGGRSRFLLQPTHFPKGRAPPFASPVAWGGPLRATGRLAESVSLCQNFKRGAWGKLLKGLAGQFQKPHKQLRFWAISPLGLAKTILGLASASKGPGRGTFSPPHLGGKAPPRPAYRSPANKGPFFMGLWVPRDPSGGPRPANLGKFLEFLLEQEAGWSCLAFGQTPFLPKPWETTGPRNRSHQKPRRHGTTHQGHGSCSGQSKGQPPLPVKAFPWARHGSPPYPAPEARPFHWPFPAKKPTTGQGFFAGGSGQPLLKKGDLPKKNGACHQPGPYFTKPKKKTNRNEAFPALIQKSCLVFLSRAA